MPAPRSLAEKQQRFTQNLAVLILWVAEQGWEVALKEVLRTPEQQRRYVQQGKSRTMQSQHLVGLAADLALFIGGVYQTETSAYEPLGEYWESLDADNRWGGRFTNPVDGNHFEVAGDTP